MQAPLDMPRDVREGEELDLAKLEAYLKDNLEGVDGALAAQQFPSGFSNLTYLLNVGEREFVLRRPPFGSKVKSAHDMGREHRILSALRDAYPLAPNPLLLCDDMDVLGAQFYVMERIKGVILRGKKPEDFTCSEDTARACCESLIDNLARLHAIDYEAVGLGGMKREGSFVERNVKGWIDRYYKSQTDEIPAIDQTAEWLGTNYPPDMDSVLIHNDYKFDNLVLDPEDLTHIIGVLDWEMSTIGDPLMDLGNGLAYWHEPSDPPLGMVPCFLTQEPGSMTRREVAECYGARAGRDVTNIGFYYVFGLLKLAVIVQQIYYRYKKGLTKDKRFAPLIFVVGALGIRAVDVIENGKV